MPRAAMCSVNIMTREDNPVDVSDVPHEHVTDFTEHVPNEGTVHVLRSSVQCWREYKEYYDPDTNTFIVSPDTIEPHDGAAIYECSCGETFTTQGKALQHLIDET